jgi:hypothetical protein
MTTTADSHADINILESVLAEQKQWFVDFAAQNLWLDQLERATIDFDQSLSTFAEGDSGRGFLLDNYIVKHPVMLR